MAVDILHSNNFPIYQSESLAKKILNFACLIPLSASLQRPALKRVHGKEKREVQQQVLNKSLEQGLNLSGS